MLSCGYPLPSTPDRRKSDDPAQPLALTNASRAGLLINKEDEPDLATCRARALDDLKLAAAMFMTADACPAQRLLDAKRQLNAMERAAGHRHLARPWGPQGIGAERAP